MPEMGSPNKRKLRTTDWGSMSLQHFNDFISAHRDQLFTLENITVDELRLFFVVHHARGMATDNKDSIGDKVTASTGTKLVKVHQAFMPDDEARTQLHSIVCALLGDLVGYFTL